MSRAFRGMRPLDDSEIAGCLQHLKTRRFSERDIVLFTLQSKLGFRIKEMLSLRIADIFPHPPEVTDTVTIMRRNLKGGKKKNTGVSSRTVPMPESCVGMLEQYYDSLTKGKFEPTDPLFPSSTTSLPLRADSCCRMFKRMADSLGLTRVGTHSCRKTFAKNIYKACKNDIMETKAALGHSNVATTQQYLSYGLGGAFMKVMQTS